MSIRAALLRHQQPLVAEQWLPVAVVVDIATPLTVYELARRLELPADKSARCGLRPHDAPKHSPTSTGCRVAGERAGR
jgi:hypothetical protein